MSDPSLRSFLDTHQPFAARPAAERAGMVQAAGIARYQPGNLVLDAFTRADDAVYAVLAGQVHVWNDPDQFGEAPQEVLGPGGLFGFSAMLTGRSIGPLAVATAEDTLVARIPAESAEPAFTSAAGAQFLVTHMAATSGHPAHQSPFILVDDLLVRRPLVVEPDATLRSVASAMTEADLPYAMVALSQHRIGLITDARLRQSLGGGADPDVAVAREVVDPEPPRVTAGSPATDALVLLLDRDADRVLVTERDGTPRGTVDPRDFMASDLTVGASIHEQLRRADTVDDLQRRARQLPRALGDLLARGISSERVITVYSAIVDTLVRRAIALVFDGQPGLSTDAFTWLSLGSNGRREAVPSSDIDAAVAFDDAVSPSQIERYCALFARVGDALGAAGSSADPHGAFPSRRAFARTNAEWRAAAEHWLASPERDQGAIMTSLLVDGRPIHGDVGLPQVARVFADLRAHPATMRLLLQESLAKRARAVPGVLHALTGRADTFDLKEYALLPIVNLARWAALSSGSAVLPTTERLRAATGTTILPEAQAQTLIEVFEVLQRIRLRYQLRQLDRGRAPGDRIKLKRLSVVDRSVITRAVREIGAAQRRMGNVSLYAELDSWTAPHG